MKHYTFSKNERLCSKRLIEYLFEKGQRFVSFPFSVYWCVVSSDTIPCNAQVLINVSKRKFKRAVDRNRTKRLMRECYRLHKHELYDLLEAKNCKIVLSLSYIQDKKRNYASMDEKYLNMLDQLLCAISNSVQNDK
ncbi:MAG: ribonuclease P protein component [Bacteroidales bacterium]|nr:ribonuclease P protein component [Bacteroidales bacterium]